jgi:hypothetical protein
LTRKGKNGELSHLLPRNGKPAVEAKGPIEKNGWTPSDQKNLNLKL